VLRLTNDRHSIKKPPSWRLDDEARSLELCSSLLGRYQPAPPTVPILLLAFGYKTAPDSSQAQNCAWLPSPKLIIIMENHEYMAMMKEKLLEIKRFYRNLKLSPAVATH